METLLEPLSYTFIQRGIIVSVIAGILSGFIGPFVVSRQKRFLGSTLQYVILPGLAVVYLYGGNVLVGMLFVVAIAILGVEQFHRQEVKEQYFSVVLLMAALSSFAFLVGGIQLTILLWVIDGIVLGISYLAGKKILETNSIVVQILLASGLPLGVALISTSSSYSVDLSHILFGNILGISPIDMWIILGIGLVIIVTLLFLYQPLLIVSFDPTLTKNIRLPSDILSRLMLLFLALTVVITSQQTGLALATIMIITPASTAYFLTRHFGSMIWVSIIIGILTSITGLYLSYYFNLLSGSVTVLTTIAIFCVVIVIKGGKALLSNWFKEFKIKWKKSNKRRL